MKHYFFILLCCLCIANVYSGKSLTPHEERLVADYAREKGPFVSTPYQIKKDRNRYVKNGQKKVLRLLNHIQKNGLKN